jgi:hypothetical protein
MSGTQNNLDSFVTATLAYAAKNSARIPEIQLNKPG